MGSDGRKDDGRVNDGLPLAATRHGRNGLEQPVRRGERAGTRIYPRATKPSRIQLESKLKIILGSPPIFPITPLTCRSPLTFVPRNELARNVIGRKLEILPGRKIRANDSAKTSRGESADADTDRRTAGRGKNKVGVS